MHILLFNNTAWIFLCKPFFLPLDMYNIMHSFLLSVYHQMFHSFPSHYYNYLLHHNWTDNSLLQRWNIVFSQIQVQFRQCIRLRVNYPGQYRQCFLSKTLNCESWQGCSKELLHNYPNIAILDSMNEDKLNVQTGKKMNLKKTASDKNRTRFVSVSDICCIHWTIKPSAAILFISQY
jgi:hypothetical protein